jgi:hypothetical protein
MEEINIENFVDEKKIEINISTEQGKLDYFPGEEIKGTLKIKGKSTLINPLFLYPLVKASISQINFYECESKSQNDIDDDKPKEFEKQLVYSKVLNYNKYLASNLMSGMELPFKLVLPQNLEPSFLYKNSYITYILTFNFPGLASKNSIELLIKNKRHFSLENKLLEEPWSLILYSKENNSISISSKSNSYPYGESIPIQIKIDGSETSLNLTKVEIGFDRLIHYNEKMDKSKQIKTIEQQIFSENVEFNEQKNNYELNINNKSTNIYYNSFERLYSKSNLPNVDLLPFCSRESNVDLLQFCTGGLIDCRYAINVKLNFKDMSPINKTIPIELYMDENKNNIIKKEIKKKNDVEKL